MVARDSSEQSLPHQLLRTLGAVYVMVIPVAAVVVLLTTRSGQRGMAVAILLTPIAPCYATIAMRSIVASLALGRRLRARANVGRELLQLGADYRILSRCSVTPGREDHIVIGPNGVFVVMACDDGGRVTASSRRLFVNARLPWRDLIDDCRVDTLRVHERLRRELGYALPVHSVLCFARALVAVGQEIQGVKVVQAPRLARLILSTVTATPLSEHHVEVVAGALTEARKPQPRPIARRPRRARVDDQGARRLALVGRVPAQRRDR